MMSDSRESKFPINLNRTPKNEPKSTPSIKKKAEKKKPSPTPKKKAVKKQIGKHKDPDYTSLTCYIKKDTHLALKKALIEKKEGISDIAEELFSKWLKSNK